MGGGFHNLINWGGPDGGSGERAHLAAWRLDDEEVRVLGALIEKEVTTPDYYPLTLNSLVAACNQRNNRNPVVGYDEAMVRNALERLRDKKLAFAVSGAEHRVPKYRQSLTRTFDLDSAGTAILCVLMLRGPLTCGEIRACSDRMHPFVDLSEIESTLNHLATRPDRPLTARLGARPGQKEPRYVHLLGDPPDTEAPLPATPTGRRTASPDRLERLEAEVAALRLEVQELRERLTQT